MRISHGEKLKLGNNDNAGKVIGLLAWATPDGRGLHIDDELRLPNLIGVEVHIADPCSVDQAHASRRAPGKAGGVNDRCNCLIGRMIRIYIKRARKRACRGRTRWRTFVAIRARGNSDDRNLEKLARALRLTREVNAPLLAFTLNVDQRSCKQTGRSVGPKGFAGE
jgi:hypothetical protein